VIVKELHVSDARGGGAMPMHPCAFPMALIRRVVSAWCGSTQSEPNDDENAVTQILERAKLDVSGSSRRVFRTTPYPSREAAAPDVDVHVFAEPLRDESGSSRRVFRTTPRPSPRGGDLPKETDSSQVKEEASVGNKRQRTGWDSGQGKEAHEDELSDPRRITYSPRHVLHCGAEP
jgi:hypothetical protein